MWLPPPPTGPLLPEALAVFVIVGEGEGADVVGAGCEATVELAGVVGAAESGGACGGARVT